MRNRVRVARSLRHQTVEAGGRTLDIAVATVAVAAAGVRVALAAPIRVTDLTRGAAARVPGFRTQVLSALAKEETGMNLLDKVGTIIGGTARAEELAGAFANVTQGKGAVGTATTAGERSMVPLIETQFAGGYGGGGGIDQTENTGFGGGGGGWARSRTVAVVEVAPEGVTVLPVVDKTAVTLAGIAAAIGLVNTLVRVRRR